MATRARIQNGVGMLGLPREIRANADGKLSAETLAYLTDLLASIVRKINGQLSLGNDDQSSQAGNLDAQRISWTFSGTPDTESAIPHGLQRVAEGYLVVGADRACIVYDSQRASWSKDSIFLKCNTASATVALLVF